ncbi:MAG: hypothetical protein LBU80_03340 [Rikenellaceae bacterium]|jgi:hypothetical protein|nr:hypothetical protein [Rikenellaceae bacterium]
MDKSELITVKTFVLPQDAALVRAFLESEGVECFVQDELTVQVDNFYSTAVGGVKLQVRKRDLQEAVVALQNGGYWNEDDLKPTQQDIVVERIVGAIRRIFRKKR